MTAGSGPADPAQAAAELARLLIGLLTERGQSVATAESLTGGLVAATLVDVAGASAVFRGGIVAYPTDVKTSLLGVPSSLLRRTGPVHAEVARAMADGARSVLSATFGLATTGVAGPDASDGHPPGTVHIAVSGPAGPIGRQLALRGDRRAIRLATVAQTLELFECVLAGRGG